MKKKKVIKRIPETDNPKEMEKTKKYKMKKNLKLRKIIKTTILVTLFIIIIVAGIFIGKIYGICKESKLNINELVIKYENSVVKDIDGNTIAVLSGDENRETIAISEMSPYIPKAFVAIEDERFYEHEGVDLKRTAAATLTYILNGGNSSFGGSTITQQLIKNLTKEDERAWQRKVKEMSRAYYIEEELSKSQILELYLNLIFLGGQTYGVEVASNYYFSKSASELTLAESAFLAGINNSPNAYSAFSTDEEDIAQVKRRAKTVVEKMYDLGNKPSDIRSLFEYGKQRKLEIARALASNPKIILLDEPAAGMNPSETEELMKTIKKIRDTFKIAILLIEHDMKLVMGICEKIYVLCYGETIAKGTPDMIAHNQDVIRAYLGTEGD